MRQQSKAKERPQLFSKSFFAEHIKNACGVVAVFIGSLVRVITFVIFIGS